MTYEEKIRKFEEQLKKAQNPQIIMTFEVMTMGDERVRSICKQHEGIKLDVSEAIIGINHPPFHKECRCVATFSVEGIRRRK